MKPLSVLVAAAALLAGSPACAQGVYTKIATYGCFYGTCQPGLPVTQMVEAAPGSFVGSLTFGALYTLGSSGEFSAVHSLDNYFVGIGTPLRASDGAFYFPAPSGGANAALYKLDLAGQTVQTLATPAVYDALTPVETPDQVLHSASVPVNGEGETFTVTLDGEVSAGVAVPKSGSIGTLLVASDGTLYGLTTPWGGSDSSLIRFQPSGRYRTVSIFPRANASLIEASDGNFYGCNSNSLFRLTPAGAYTAIYTFPGGGLGSAVYGCGIQASDGNLYGTTSEGGAYGYGTVFRATLDGQVATVYSFTGDDQAQHPSQYVPGLVQGSDGKLYGQTSGPYANSPGSNIGATTYSLDLGLPRPLPAIVRASSRRAPAGSTIVVTGRSFLGTTAVTLNGIPASFTVKAAEYLEVTLPAGVKGGKLTVTTPNGSVTSTFAIRVG